MQGSSASVTSVIGNHRPGGREFRRRRGKAEGGFAERKGPTSNFQGLTRRDHVDPPGRFKEKDSLGVRIDR